ncbi:MAG: PAS domain S-box protein [Bacteroidota bacterium]|nr:PAS domain S-box protein [Bacteroidota bacterium]
MEDLNTIASEIALMLNAMHSGIAIINPDGKIVRCNNCLANIIDRSESEILTLHCYEAIHNMAERPKNCAFLKACEDHKTHFYEIERKGKTYEVSVDPIIDDNKVVGAVHILNDITERKQAQEAFQTAHQRLLDVVELLPDAAFILGQDKKVFAWNHALEQMTGIKKEEVLGKDDFIYALPVWGQRIPLLIDFLDMDFEAEKKRYKYLKRTGNKVYGEAFIPHFNGGNGAYLTMTATPLYDIDGSRFGSIEIIRDITEIKQAEIAIVESENKYRTLFESASEGIILINDNKIVDCNLQAIRLFRCSKEELIGKTPIELSPLQQASGILSEEVALKQIETVLKGELQCFEWIHKRPDGSCFNAEVNLNCFTIDGETCIQSMIRDITERKRVQQELVHSKQQLSALANHLQTIRESERATIAREIHDDLGQQLTAIKIELAWITGRIPLSGDELKNELISIEQIVDSLVESVQKISSELRPGLLDDLGLIPAIRWQFNEFVKKTKMNGDISLPDEDLRFDDKLCIQLFRVFQESLTNIARHSEATHVKVELKHQMDELLLLIEDNGKGITEEQINSSKSLGLLGMCERIRSAEGNITISGKPGLGTKVCINLPIKTEGQL